MERVDPVLFQLSRDYVGDTAETASLLWPESDAAKDPPTVAEAVDALLRMTRLSAMRDLGSLLDRLDAAGRFALLKLATGAMRIGISARLAKVAFAQAFEVSVDDVEEYWHGQTAPYHALFDWAANSAEPPNAQDLPLFRPFMLAHPLEEAEVDMTAYAAEWKWDGIRVQIVHVANERGGDAALFAIRRRHFGHFSGDRRGHASALCARWRVAGARQPSGRAKGDGQGGAASFNALQQRLGRKTVSKAMLADYPAFVRLYDILIEEARI